MDYILENIFSTWIFGIIPIIILFWISTKFGGLSLNSQRFSKLYFWLSIIFLPVVAFIFCWFNETSWGYGYVKEIQGSANNKNSLCFVSKGDFHLSSRGGRSRDYNARLYVLDPNTGERIYRDVIGDFVEVIELRGDTLLYKGGEGYYVTHNINTRKRIAMMDVGTLPSMFPELSAGLSDCEYNKHTGMINITALTGKNYYLDPFLMELYAESPKSGKGHYNNDDVRAETYDLKLSKEETLNLHRKKNGSLFEMIIEKRAKNKYEENVVGKELIEASILGHSWELKRFLVKSYETTRKENFIINCFSYEGKLLWQVKQNELNADDFYTKGNSQTSGRYYGYTSTMDIHQVVGDSFMFTIQGFVFSVDINSGKLNWQARL